MSDFDIADRSTWDFTIDYPNELGGQPNGTYPHHRDKANSIIVSQGSWWEDPCPEGSEYNAYGSKNPAGVSTGSCAFVGVLDVDLLAYDWLVERGLIRDQRD